MVATTTSNVWFLLQLQHMLQPDGHMYVQTFIYVLDTVFA